MNNDDVVDMDLPQTDPGVPAAGIDPTVTELESLNSIAGIFDWLGTAAPARAALVAALGGGEPRLRDLVYIRGSEWDAAISGIFIPGTDGADSTPLAPLQLGHMAMLRRIARLRLGLRAVEATAVPLHQAEGPPQLQGQAHSSAAVTNLSVPQQPSTDPRLKLSVVLDPSMDADLVRLPHHHVRGLFNSYALARGAEPAEDVEPTLEQISAVAQVVAADLVPYADFSILGPHGRRLVGKLNYLAWSFQPDGTWLRKELSGPPSFDHWWASFRVLRTVFLLLDIAPPELLDNYGELVRSFHLMYGPSAWFIIYTADVRMRSEHFDRLRRYAERDHDAAVKAGSPLSFDPAKPWHATFRGALADKLWWDENLHRPAMLFLTRVKTASESVLDGTAQDSLDSGEQHHPGAGQRRRSRSRQRKKQAPRNLPPDGDHRGGPDYSKGGSRICDQFNSASGCSRRGCKYVHMCKGCRQQGHGLSNCPSSRSSRTSTPVRLVPAPPSPPLSNGEGGGGHGKGNRGGKGGGKRR